MVGEAVSRAWYGEEKGAVESAQARLGEVVEGARLKLKEYGEGAREGVNSVVEKVTGAKDEL